ncbi:HEAT repeat domain-containing protein [Geodermatophilus sp. DSM 45219]|uniref:HEAT repeat domain-containing protein n=1 Tax=Geodermatophilus sp. DSM 45219 TaxID=1881103 RepID=UPI00088EA664|nr:HEAT repeat domain-containing protein [Geodermatophilus sp. DSM 45219]SDN57983.1 HEAT repeat [Geodermatophilus sp. DSM 45219]
MNSLAAPAAAATAVLGTLVVVLLVAVAAVHTLRARRLSDAEERRADLMALVHDLLDDGDGDAVVAAPADLDEVLLHLLPQLRGADREAIQTALTRRGVVARAVADLDARAAWRRGRAATLLGSTAGRDHLARLTALLSDRSREVRCAAARALGRVGDPAAVHGLLASLTTARPLPAGVVGMAVLDLGTAVLPALRATLVTGSPAARALSADVVGLHGDVAATAALAELLTDPRQPEDVRRAAATALGRIGDPAATGPLTEVLVDAALSGLRRAAAEALGRIGDPAAAPVLLAGLTCPAREVAAACGDALGELGAEGTAVLTDAAARGGPLGAAAALTLEAVPQPGRLVGV